MPKKKRTEKKKALDAEVKENLRFWTNTCTKGNIWRTCDGPFDSPNGHHWGCLTDLALQDRRLEGKLWSLQFPGAVVPQ